LGEGYSDFSTIPIIIDESPALSPDSIVIAEDVKVAEPEAEELSERAIAHKTARAGMRICLWILLVLFFLLYSRDLWVSAKSAWLAWPDLVYEQHPAGGGLC
jgi:hypothetical protein